MYHLVFGGDEQEVAVAAVAVVAIGAAVVIDLEAFHFIGDGDHHGIGGAAAVSGYVDGKLDGVGSCDRGRDEIRVDGDFAARHGEGGVVACVPAAFHGNDIAVGITYEEVVGQVALVGRRCQGDEVVDSGCAYRSAFHVGRHVAMSLLDDENGTDGVGRNDHHSQVEAPAACGCAGVVFDGHLRAGGDVESDIVTEAPVKVASHEVLSPGAIVELQQGLVSNIYVAAHLDHIALGSQHQEVFNAAFGEIMALSPVVIHLERRGERGCHGAEVDDGLLVSCQVDVIVTDGAFRDTVVNGKAGGMVGDAKADSVGAVIACILIACAGNGQGVGARVSDFTHRVTHVIGDGQEVVGAFGKHVSIVVCHGVVHLDGVAGVPHINVFHTRNAGVSQIVVV